MTKEEFEVLQLDLQQSGKSIKAYLQRVFYRILTKRLNMGFISVPAPVFLRPRVFVFAEENKNEFEVYELMRRDCLGMR